MAKRKNYQVTIGYKAVIAVDVMAGSKKDAEEYAVELMKTQRGKMFKLRGFDLQDDSFAAHGICDMDETWNMVQN